MALVGFRVWGLGLNLGIQEGQILLLKMVFLWRNLGTLAADSWLLVRAWFSRGFWLSRSVLLKGVELLTFRSFRFVSSLLGFRASFGLVDPVFQRVFRDDRS